MFEESLLESAHLLRTQNRWPAFASVSLQAVVAAMIVTIPLLHPAALSLASSAITLTAPAPLRPTPPPVQRSRVEATASSTPAVPEPQTLLQRSPLIPTTNIASIGNEAPITNSIGVMSNGNNPLAAITSSQPVAPRVVIAAKPQRVNISQGVSAGLLLAPIQPAYPIIAKASHTEGTVVIHAIISKEGRIESASVMSGPQLLQGAALDAVRSARYRPYRLNGDPTEVETTFSITFHMS